MASGGITTTYTYDGNGSRVKKSLSSGGTTFYIGNHREVTDTGAVTKHYYPSAGSGLPLARSAWR